MTSSSEREICVVERSYNYIFDKGVLKCSFSSHPRELVQTTLYKKVTIDSDKVELLAALQFEWNRRAITYDLLQVRDILIDYYKSLESEAIAEIARAQKDTSGIAVCRAIRSFVVPHGYIRYVDEYSHHDTLVDKFPYNFGVRIIQESHVKLRSNIPVEFKCLAHDSCRMKATTINLEINSTIVRAGVRGSRECYTNEQLVERHLKDNHWSQLIQRGYTS